MKLKHLKPFKVQINRYLPRWYYLLQGVVMIATGLARFVLIPFGYDVAWDMHYSGWGLRRQHRFLKKES